MRGEGVRAPQPRPQDLGAGNRTLLRASDEQELVHAMCQVIVETGGYRVASVAYAVHDTQKTLRWVASAGFDASALAAANFTWADTEFGHTASAAAIRTGQPVVGRHIFTDPAYDGPASAAVRTSARQKGYASASAFPLRVEGEILGALAMCAAEADAFDEAEVKLLSELADDLAYGIANLRVRAQHRAAQATIAHLAYYDTLTGLPNRTRLLECLEAAIDAARLQHRSLALLHLEVGRFHEINKVLGYHSGDELLKELGRRLADVVGQHETLARVGEAEFALLLPHAGAEVAVEVARRLANTVHPPLEVTGLMLDARVGIGIALYPGHAADADALMRRANAAMRQARPARSGYAMYTGDQEKENTRRLSLMGDLHRAIAHD
jgi:diguanylate cyclase (GGDEF)-like protein